MIRKTQKRQPDSGKQVGTLRIIAGQYRSRLIKVPEAAALGEVRPTGDRVREAIFSILGPSIAGATVLDIFAGSGAYGIEAISRGATKACFVELSKQTARCVVDNLHSLGLNEPHRVINQDALLFVQNQADTQFNYVFVDPPYPVRLQASFWLGLKHHLAPEATVIFRCHKPDDFVVPQGYIELKSKKYSGTYVVFLTVPTL